MGLEMIWVNKLAYSHENRMSRGETIASIDKINMFSPKLAKFLFF